MRNVLITAEEEKLRDTEGFLAVKAIHAVLDDDNSGSIDRSESADFLKEDLKFGGSDKVRRENAFHSNDESITVDDLWENWFQSEERGWNNKQVVDWLTNQVKLPQYANSFLNAKVTGLDFPRLAVQNSSFLSNRIGIKNYVHRQKLQLKALDLVLFGFQDSSSIAKDIALAGLLGLLVAVLIIFKKHKNRSKQQMEELSSVLNKLRDMETDFAGVQNKLEEENHNRQSNNTEDSENIELLRSQLRELENERRIAEENGFGEGFPFALQPLLRRTYEMEWAYLYQQKLDCLHEMGEAKEFVDKMRRKQMSFVNSLKLATGATSGTDDIDNKIFSVKARMEKIKMALNECTHRWTDIEALCGFSITESFGMLAATVPLNALQQPENSKKLTLVSMASSLPQNNGTYPTLPVASDWAKERALFDEEAVERKLSELPLSVNAGGEVPRFSLQSNSGSQADECSVASSSNLSNTTNNQKNHKNGAKNRLSKFFRRKISKL
uniref:SAM domain-containing protein n=1 Tax=Globodera pallida TaxID=36090 RepID=A0A183C0D9_GLOPA